MATFVEEDYLWGEDLELIMQLVEEGVLEDEHFNAEMTAIVEDIGVEGNNDHPCNLCNKICKSKRGLTRHINAKHADATVDMQINPQNSKEYPSIHNLELKVVIEKAAKKLSEDKCFHYDHRQLFQNFKISTNECLEIWEQFRHVFEKFNGNAEKYYSNFYHFCLPEKHIFTQLPRQLSALLCSEIANFCLAKLTAPNNSVKLEGKKFDFTQKDLNCLQYLAGYCFRTMFSCIRNSRLWQNDHSQQCLSILKAAKSNDEQSFVDTKNRGGLWRVSKKAHSIFQECEKHFVNFTSDFQYKIDSQKLLSKIMKDCCIKSDSNCICNSADRKVDKEISMNLLENLVLLYIRVRSHSYAKKIKETHKTKKKASKKRSLRTQIKQATSSTELGH